jgi:hypothetical protein
MRAAELERERALRIKAEAECAEADAELQVGRLMRERRERDARTVAERACRLSSGGA